MKGSFSYSSSELEALVEAPNYYRAIVSSVAPYLGRRIVEVGAGIGTFSEVLLAAAPDSRFVLFEPADNLFRRLRERFAGHPRVDLVHGYFEDLGVQIQADCIVMVNVLEHVEDDDRVLRSLHRFLLPQATLLLFVPAFPWLYGTLDEAFGHHRRYTKRGLEQKLQGAGFDVIRLRYFNFPGTLGWFLVGRVLRRKTLRFRDVRFYDRLVIPWVARIERRWAPPLGQSLIAIGRKS